MNILFVVSAILFNLLVAGIFIAEKQNMCDGVFDFYLCMQKKKEG